MLQSEQLDTKMILFANDEIAAGLLIQRLPVSGSANLAAGLLVRDDEDQIGRNEHFQRIALLAATLTAEELLSLTPEQVLHRLFWQETLRVFEPQTPRFACSCSRDRVAGMLRGLGEQDMSALVEERGAADVACDFCGKGYHFDGVDMAELFTPEREAPPSSDRMQ